MQTVSVRDDFYCGSRAEGLGRVNSNNNQGKGGGGIRPHRLHICFNFRSYVSKV